MYITWPNFGLILELLQSKNSIKSNFDQIQLKLSTKHTNSYSMLITELHYHVQTAAWSLYVLYRDQGLDSQGILQSTATEGTTSTQSFLM